MPIDFTCQGCGTHFQAKDELAGRSVRCRTCGATVRIPDAVEIVDDFDELAEAPEPAPNVSMRFARANPPTSPRQRRTYSFDQPSRGPNPWAIVIGIGLGVVFLAAFGILLVIVASRANPRANPADINWNPPNAALPIIPSQPATTKSNVPFTPIKVDPPEFPERGPAVALEPGVEFHEIVLRPRPGQHPGPGRNSKLWLYLPEGKHEDKSLSCVLIAPAGSTLLTGMKLENGDRAEHVPYVRAGFAVLSFELDGGVPASPTTPPIAPVISNSAPPTGVWSTLKTPFNTLSNASPRSIRIGFSSPGTVPPPPSAYSSPNTNRA